MKKLFIFILFLLCISISSEEKKKSIYIGTIQSLNLPIGTDTKVRNEITLSLIKNYKTKISVLDDEVVKKLLERLKLQQLTGCSTEKCEKQLNDALNADQKIEGTIINEGGKYSLTLKLFKLEDGSPSIANQIKKEFNSNQINYYVTEMTRALIETNYQVSDKNAPQEVDIEKINLSNIDLKEIAVGELSVLNFKSNDSTVDDLIRFSSETLKEGDDSFKAKNYENALKNYESILKGIARLPEDKQAQAKGYKDEITKRIDFSYINIYNKSLNATNQKVKNETNATTQKIIQFRIEYEAILVDYQSRIKKINIPANPKIETAIIEKLEKLDLIVFGIEEKKADLDYENYKFTIAINEYNRIFEVVSSRPKTKAYSDYRTKLEKKITATKETGTSFVENKVKAYCALADKMNFQMKLAEDKGKIFEVQSTQESMKDTMLDARKTLIKSEFANEELYKFYNDTVDRINTDKKGSLAQKADKSSAKFELSNEITKSQAILYSVVFPGLGQIKERPDKQKSKLIFGAGTFLSIFGVISIINYSLEKRSYDRLQGTEQGLYFGLPQFIPLFLYNDNEKFQDQRSQVTSSQNIMNNFVGAYIALYAYSLLDIIFFTDRKAVLGFNQLPIKNGFDFQVTKSNPGFNSQLENKYIISYTYHW